MNTISSPASLPASSPASSATRTFRYDKYAPTHLTANDFLESSHTVDRILPCYCCKGSGVVSPYLLNKYGIMEASITDPTVPCRANGCSGQIVRYTSPTTGEEQTALRFAYGTDDRVTREECDYIAAAERAVDVALRAAAASQPPMTTKERLAQTLPKVAKPVAEPTPEEIAAAEQVQQQAETAAASAKDVLADIFGDIA